MVPILLTLGVLLPTLGTLWFFTSEDSPFRALSIAVPISLIAGGTLVLVLGILNVMHLAYLMRGKGTSRRSNL